jgi:hypothetical protein
MHNSGAMRRENAKLYLRRHCDPGITVGHASLEHTAQSAGNLPLKSARSGRHGQSRRASFAFRRGTHARRLTAPDIFDHLVKSGLR